LLQIIFFEANQSGWTLFWFCFDVFPYQEQIFFPLPAIQSSQRTPQVRHATPAAYPIKNQASRQCQNSKHAIELKKQSLCDQIVIDHIMSQAQFPRCRCSKKKSQDAGEFFFLPKKTY
jgi:hypothetical protein